ncbi:nuclear transport factor 2 family protein [Oceanobacillus kapialis]|uniref:nuclear transport factor 2 family protein n=1 Tax=Oceanobacillus kapialis TaxID=481353 RepID=UPI00384C45ED
MSQFNLSELVRNYFKAYETKERESLEELLSHDFTFNSPVDDNINRETYFERCWPSCKDIQEYHIQNLVTDGDEVVIRYECLLKSNASFQNMEHFLFRDGKISEIKVYFGSDLKHESVFEDKAKRLNEAFVTGNTDYIVENLTEDVQWNFVGDSVIGGRETASNMLESMRGMAAEENTIKSIIVQGNNAVIEGTMKFTGEDAGEKLYAFCDIYTFDNSPDVRIKQLSAYLIELTNEDVSN